MTMQPSKRGVALLISLLLLSISTSTMCSASQVRAPRRKQQAQAQRRLAKSSKEKAPKGTNVAKEVAGLKKEEDMFFGEEETFSEEITHDASQELTNIAEHSGLGGLEGFATMEHNSDKEKGREQGKDKSSEKEEKTDKKEETKKEKEEDSKEEPESEPDAALEAEPEAVEEVEDVSEEVKAPKDESEKGQGKEKVSNSPDEFINYDDPEAPPPTASPTVFPVDAFLRTDETLGSDLGESETGGEYDVKESHLVPASTVLSRQKTDDNSYVGLILGATAGLVVFSAFLLALVNPKGAREEAKMKELSFGGELVFGGDENGNETMTDTDSSVDEATGAIGRSAFARAVTLESDTEQCPMTPPCQVKWENSSDPWSYAQSRHNLDDIEKARQLNPDDDSSESTGSPVGRRVYGLLQGTKQKMKRMVPGAQNSGYEEFDASPRTGEQQDLSQLYPQPSEEHQVHDL